MLNLASYQQIIESESLLSSQLKELISHILESKEFVFKLQDLKFETDELQKYNIIIIHGDQVQLAENNLLCYACYLEFCKILSYNASDNIDDLFGFLSQLREYFFTGSFNGITQFLNGVNTIAIYHQQTEYKSNILEHSNSWKKEPLSPLYIFSESFSRLLPYNIYEVDYLLQLLRKLFDLHEYNKPDIINGNINSLSAGIRAFARTNQSTAEMLLAELLSNYDAINETISISIVVGVLEVDEKFFSKVNEMAQSELYQPAIGVALSLLNIKSNEEASIILELISLIKNDSDKYLLQLPRLYFSIINNKNISDPQIFKKSFEDLEGLIKKSKADISYIVLQQAQFSNNYEKEITDILLLLLEQEYFDGRFASVIGAIFYRFNDAKYFFKFLFAYSQKVKFKIDENVFNHTIPYLRDKNLANFDNELIALLINDLGEIRWMGTRLLTLLVFQHNMRKFSFDILSLSPKDQFKLFTSVFSLFLEPKVTLPLVLDFFTATNEFVRESFICRIELLTEDYGGSVLEVMDEEWHSRTELQTQIYERVKEYSKAFSQQLKNKAQIKELNPLYTQSRFFNAFMSNYSKTFRRTLSDGVNKNSIFMQIATTVILAKGGGWANTNTGEISQLGKFESSFTLPGSYYICPDSYDWEKAVERQENWQNFLKEWEAIL